MIKELGPIVILFPVNELMIIIRLFGVDMGSNPTPNIGFRMHRVIRSRGRFNRGIYFFDIVICNTD